MSDGIQNHMDPPTTPPRGRLPSRYPTGLSKAEPGRVPLHRRGTSRTLETLEDLLRENGYKETRILTPEAERIQAMSEERRRQSTWRFGELFAAWLPGAREIESVADDETTPAPRRSRRPVTPTQAVTYHSTPSSPLAHARPLDQFQVQTLHPISSPNSASTTTLSSMRSGVSVASRAVSYQPSSRNIHERIPAIGAETSSTNLRTYAQVSAAGKYLRHMASTPIITKPPVPSLRRPPSERVSSLRVEPPLPPTWLESVTKAVLRTSGGAAHIGGPVSRPSSRQSERPVRSLKNSYLLDDNHTKASGAGGRSASGLQPSAILYLPRPQTALGVVNAAHVTCRSAPGSRSTSRIGDRAAGGYLRSRNDRIRRGSRAVPANRVPSLAATRIENDAWTGMHWQDGKRVPTVQLEDASYEEAVDSDESDDEGELDLARLLVPPKRQYSIQSLRKHLHVAHAQNRATYAHSEWEEEGVVTRGRGRRVDIDESDGYPTLEQTFERSNSSSKHRIGLPGAWAALSKSK